MTLSDIHAICANILRLNSDLLQLSHDVSELQLYLRKPIPVDPSSGSNPLEVNRSRTLGAPARDKVEKHIHKSNSLKNYMIDAGIRLGDLWTEQSDSQDRDVSQLLAMKMTYDGIIGMLEDMWELHTLLIVALLETM